jgi:hypothetical protein
MADAQLAQVQAQLDALHNQLRADGLLDEQFTQLLQLQDESNPDFVAEVRGVHQRHPSVMPAAILLCRRHAQRCSHASAGGAAVL